MADTPTEFQKQWNENLRIWLRYLWRIAFPGRELPEEYK